MPSLIRRVRRSDPAAAPALGRPDRRRNPFGHLRQLYEQIRRDRPDVGLRLVWSSWASEMTAPRLKYIEPWFSTVLPDAWEFRPVKATD
jgi:hypothetical protein